MPDPAATPSAAVKRGPGALGITALTLALVAAASVTMIGLTSFTSFNPPNWLRIATMVPLPFALLISVFSAVAGLRNGSRRGLMLATIALDVAVIAAFVVMISQGE